MVDKEIMVDRETMVKKEDMVDREGIFLGVYFNFLTGFRNT